MVGADQVLTPRGCHELGEELHAFISGEVHMGVEPKIGVVNPPKWMVYNGSNPINQWMI